MRKLMKFLLYHIKNNKAKIFKTHHQKKLCNHLPTKQDLPTLIIITPTSISAPKK